MQKALTLRTLELLKPTGRRYDVRDAHLPGFNARVGSGGNITIEVVYRYGPKQRRVRLGRYPLLGLTEARERAMEMLRKVNEGGDPSVSRRTHSHRVEHVVDEFITKYAKPKNRTWADAQALLRREFVNRHGHRDIRTIARAEILDILDANVERGAPYQANRARSHLLKLFNWCIERSYVERNPVQGIKPLTKERKRDRILTTDEVSRAPERYEPMRALLNRSLAFAGLEVDQAGTLSSVEAARTLPEAEQRARELRADLEGRGVHADVLRFCRAELLADNYFHAVQEAVKSVAVKMRARTGLTDDGTALVDRVLGGDPPLLAINARMTISERSEQSGFANLVRGAFGMFRNPTAHEARIHWPMTKEDAEDLLTILSLIHRRLDAAHMPARV